MYDTGGTPWYACGSTKTFRSGSCVDREPVATQLREAQQHIKRLEREIELFREHSDYGDVCLVEVILKGEELTRQENQNKQ